MSTELSTQKEERNLVTSSLSLINDEITSDMIKIPRLQLLQSNSPVVQDGIETSDGPRTFKQGTFHNSLTNTNYGESIDIIPIAFKRGAIYMTNDDGMVCRSYDRINNMHGGKCDACPYHDEKNNSAHYDNWRKENGKNIKPLCQKTYDVMVYSIKDKQPMQLTFKSSSYGAWESAVTALKSPGNDAFRLGIDKEKNGVNTYFVMKFIYPFKASHEDRVDAVGWRLTLEEPKAYVVDEAKDDIKY